LNPADSHGFSSGFSIGRYFTLTFPTTSLRTSSASGVCIYGVLEYQFFTAADDAAYLVLEGALRHRFVSYYPHNVPVTMNGIQSEIAARTFTITA
jgi:hypothetical protein